MTCRRSQVRVLYRPPHPQTIRSGDFFVVDGTGLEQHGHAAGVANNSPVGCCLVRGFQRPGMSTKKAPPAGAPFAPPRLGGTGQEQCKSEPFVKKQRQGIIMAMVSCLLCYMAHSGAIAAYAGKKGKFLHIGVFFRLAVWYTRLSSNKSKFVVLLIYIYAFYIKKRYFSSATVRNQRNIVILGGSNHEISLS